MGFLTLIDIPDYATVVNASTTAFGTSLFTDLLPWAGAIAVIVIAGLILMKLRVSIVGGIGKAIGVKRGRRGRRRR